MQQLLHLLVDFDGERPARSSSFNTRNGHRSSTHLDRPPRIHSLSKSAAAVKRPPWLKGFGYRQHRTFHRPGNIFHIGRVDRRRMVMSSGELMVVA
jgi:hypothetical protein